MNNKKVFLILILAFALLIGGAYVLYDRLGQSMETEQLMVEEPQVEVQEPEQSEQQEEPEEAPPSEPEAQPEEPSAPAPTQAPDFTVYDLDGNEVHLSDFIGKPVVLNFWASWCGPCKMEMPDFQEAYLELGEEIAFLMVNMTDGGRETVEAASAFVAEQGYTFPVFYDTASHAAMTYGVYSLPTTYFLDAEGYGIAVATGAIDAELLQKGIDLIYTPAP